MGPVASTGEAATIRIHHSFFELPYAANRTTAFGSLSRYGLFWYRCMGVGLAEGCSDAFFPRTSYRWVDRNAPMRVSLFSIS